MVTKLIFSPNQYVEWILDFLEISDFDYCLLLSLIYQVNYKLILSADLNVWIWLCFEWIGVSMRLLYLTAEVTVHRYSLIRSITQSFVDFCKKILKYWKFGMWFYWRSCSSSIWKPQFFRFNEKPLPKAKPLLKAKPHP